MYLPKHFEEKDPDVLFNFIREHSFGLLITAKKGVPQATHLPFLLKVGEKTKLLGHMAKANKQWKQFSDMDSALVVFQGSHSYVSPAWYETFGVPTWNYLTVHVYGRPSIVSTDQAAEDILAAQVSKYEASVDSSWIPEYPAKQMAAIVVFEIEITDIKGKFKLNQNRPEVDQRNVMGRLSALGSDDATGVADRMQKNLEDDSSDDLLK